jgi:hypothetical protein
MAAPFLTRLESCRDPQVLWPLAAGLSVLAHGALWLSLQPWIRLTSSPEPPPAISVQLLPLAPDPEANPGVSPASPSAASPDSVPDLAPVLKAEASSATPPTTEAAPSLAPAPAPDPVLDSTMPTPVPSPALPMAPAPQVSSPPLVTPPTTVSPTPMTPPPSVTSPAPVVPPPVAPSPSSTGGQLLPLGLSPTPYGRDWPDTPPRLLSTAGINLAPWLAGCGVTDLGAMAPPGTTIQIPLRVRVEADGTVSAAYVDVSSGQPALDNLVICLGQRQLRLAPALVDGQPHVTDAYQVDLQMQF